MFFISHPVRVTPHGSDVSQCCFDGVFFVPHTTESSMRLVLCHARARDAHEEQEGGEEASQAPRAANSNTSEREKVSRV